MSQTPNSHDPFASEPGTPDQEQPSSQAAAPSSDPSLHPHDPYAYDAGADGADPLNIDPDPSPSADPQLAPESAPFAQSAPGAQPTDGTQSAPGTQDPYAAPGGAPAAAQSPYGQQAQTGQQTYAGQQPYAGQQSPSGQQAPGGSASASAGETLPPAGTPGVYEGPLSGQAVSSSDSRLWATLAQAAVAVGHVVSWGFLGWVGPLVIFLVYKDRDRFVRFHAAEALNGAIAVFAIQLVLTIAITILTFITFGIASILYPLVGLPALLQLVFSIIGAVKANHGEYWTYPFNLRLVK